MRSSRPAAGASAPCRCRATACVSASCVHPAGGAMHRFNVNGEPRQVEADPDTPLLWVLREQLGLTGTKFGCGIARCGACTVHVDGSAVRSCSFPLSEAKDRKITTIEGLSHN